LGYTTIRQSANGIIHVLATKDYPGLHYEFNEAWLWSDDGDILPETSGGEVKSFKEYYPSGQLKSEWSARICPNGRYLLEGMQKEYFSDGKLEHQALYQNGRKVGREVLMNKDGSMRWSWERSLVTNRGTWTIYWPNGKKKIESRWLTNPTARDAARQFFGYVADGPCVHFDQDGKPAKTYLFKDGVLTDRNQ
jgi:antitoxin component YwqK of YwqJK toxin-antitoxin module